MGIDTIFRHIFRTRKGMTSSYLPIFYTFRGIKFRYSSCVYTLKGINDRYSLYPYTFKSINDRKIRGIHILPGMIIFFGVLTLFSPLTSCRHKDLLFDDLPDVRVEIVFDWHNDMDANPAGMRLFFYPMEMTRSEVDHFPVSAAIPTGGNPIQFDLHGKIGGTVYLPAGTYRIISYNNDSEVMQYNDTEDIFFHHATTNACGISDFLNGRQQSPQRLPVTYCTSTNDNNCNLPANHPACSSNEYIYAKTRTSANENDRAKLPIDQFWATVSDVVHVSNITQSSETQVITLYPRPVHCLYSCEIRHVTNLEYVAQVSGAISGLAPSFHFEKAEVDEATYAIPFAARTNLKENTITGQFLTFGHHPSNGTRHRLSLFVLMTDGTKYRFGSTSDRFDVTEQIDTASNRRRVHVIVDSLDIPLTIPGGFQPTPDDWTEINTDVPI